MRKCPGLAMVAWLMTEPFNVVSLENGLAASFTDCSNRYFGDFYRVCIAVKVEIPLASIELPVELADAAGRLQGPLCFERSLERMGVASCELQTVRDALVDGFLATSRSYLCHPQFPLRVLKRKLQRQAPVRPLYG